MKQLHILFITLSLFFFSCSNKQSNSTNVNHDNFKQVNPDFVLSSIAVKNNVLLASYKCEPKVKGVENSIPLSWKHVPEGTKSLAIVMYHYPKKANKTEINSYLLLWDIDPSIHEIPYSMADKGSWYMGANKDGNAISYTSPCSHGKSKHEYIIALYALSATPPDLPKSSSLSVDYNTFMNALNTVNIIDRTTLHFFDKK